MLHDILLSLSGIPSPILEHINVKNQHADNTYGSFAPHISEPEQDMLKALASIADLQSMVKAKSVSVSTAHFSPVCRAISASVKTEHLQAFTNRVLDVERSILQNDAAYVGAYSSVPLSTLLTEFQPWTRPLGWLLKTLEFLSADASTSKIFLYLNRECQTGYSDLRDIATSLLVTAEKAWINCLMPWLLFGELPHVGRDTFMIKTQSTDRDVDFVLDHDHVPCFVSDEAVDSILAIGKAISQIRSRKWQQTGAASSIGSISQLQSFALEKVKLLSYPINANDLDQVVESVNNRLSETSLTQFLPVDMIIGLLTVAKRFLLLQDNDFAATLVKQADRYLQSQSSTLSSRPVRKLGRLEDLKISETELDSILGSTWSELSTSVTDNSSWRNALAWIRLTSDISATPINVLLPTPTGLKLHLPAQSPLQMFMSSAQISKYTEISAYLISIQCAKMRMVNLWSTPVLRRRTQISSTRSKKPISKPVKGREEQRARLIRPHWACASQAILLFSELSAYLHGEVIEKSWSDFESWFGEQRDSRPPSSGFSSRPTTASSRVHSTNMAEREPRPLEANTKSTSRINDPRVLDRAHRSFLDTLYRTLLLSNTAFISILRDLLNAVNHYTALFHRIQAVWQGLDNQQERIVANALFDYSKEEQELLEELGRTRANIVDAIHDLVGSIREAEKQRDVTDLGTGILEVSLQGKQDFKPWTARSLDRLLMKLDSLSGDDKEETYEDAIVGYET